MTNPSPGLPHPVRRVSPTSPNSAAITSSMLPIPMRRVPLTELRERVPTASTSDRHYTNAERRLPPRLHQSVRRVVPRPPSNAASFSGFPELSKPMRRVPSCTPEQWASIFCFPEFCGELCSEQKQHSTHHR